MAVASAYGHGTEALLAGVLSGKPAFSPVTRFDINGRRVGVAATLPGSPDLLALLTSALEEVGASASDRLHLAIHNAGTLLPGWDKVRTYTSACVAASEAVADAAAAIALGDAQRVVVAAGYLVEPYQFALFDAGRALAVDEAVRPFSLGRKGILLGDGVTAIVLEAAGSTAAKPLAWVRGWGRAGDAYHVCQPRPDGSGMARAIEAAMRRAAITPLDLGYVNAHGSGSQQSDVAEANALRLALGVIGQSVPVSSTKSLHGQALEASPLIELIATVLAMREGQLPANAGFLEPDLECPLNLILDEPLGAKPRYALSLNSAFGGANTALVVGAP
ncbi:MAG TPA: 3-ketoacyl-ACP synthase [Micromonosporaceae bacterium]|nr:3-ketoacyl-ACP synthase [Micromonosporaceae bacterium]